MAIVFDPKGDFIPVYTGPRGTIGDALDVKSAEVIYDAAAHTFTLQTTSWGPIAAALGTSSSFVWGFDRGQGTERFVNDTPTSTGVGVVFDSVVAILPNGQVTVNRIVGGPAPPTVIPAGSPGAAVVDGDSLSVTIDARLLPVLGPDFLAFADYDWNLWPRAGAGNANISDFAPNDGGPDAVTNVTIINADEVGYVVHEDDFEDGNLVVVRLNADDISGVVSAWSLVDAAKSVFTIDRATGQLSFRETPEDDTTYTAFVSAIGANGQVETQEVSVEVQHRGNLIGDRDEADHFVFSPGFEHNKIKGFAAGSGPNHDVLEIDRALVGNVSEAEFLAALLQDNRHGRDVRIELGNDAEIHLKDVALQNLTVDNFHFF